MGPKPAIWLVIGLVVFAALNSVLSLGYYAPLVNRMYRRTPSAAVVTGRPAPALMSVPVVILLAAVVVIGFWPAVVQGITAPAAGNLVAMFRDGPAAAITWLAGH